MSRLPVLALVGRPNVGKSTLFNRLTRSRSALVADVPGLTRDRQYGRGRSGERSFIVVDSGGFEPVAKTGIAVEMARQTRQAVLEADAVLFVVDGREGLTAHDLEIARELRRTAQRVLVAVNKTEGMPRQQVAAEFHELGLGEPLPISAAHGEGVRDLVDIAFEELGEAGMPAQPEADEIDAAGGSDAHAAPEGTGQPSTPATPRPIRVAIVGRPNAGKSTLINTLLGEERLIAFDQPGTTRDSVEIDFERNGRPYTLIDTAGLRRRGKVTDMVEKFSVIKTLQAIEDCNVCVLMLDAGEQVADQDATIAGYVLEAGRALVVAVNKWDAVDAAARERLRSELDRKLHFLRFARLHFVSALKGSGVGALMRSVDQAYAAATAKLGTPKLSRSLHEAVERQPPPRRGQFRPKMRYAHQGGQNPPVIVIHGTGLDKIGDTYRRYLEGWFREAFSLQGTPLRIEFRSAANPYHDRD
ncbi:MAG TPA: ribosome biogenesis GTPase Der [Burkholderiaceae bacterium]|nr:ribosome biogenesis GTPase Der [Burkholderiaceae bacterium]